MLASIENIDDLIEHLTTKEASEIIYFCGAGISRNSGLPLAVSMLQTILSKLKLDKDDEPDLLYSDGNLAMPFENFMEAFIEHNGDTTLLNVFKLGEPNNNHLFLGRLMAENRINLVATTNFDTLIEQAHFFYSKESLTSFKSEDDFKSFPGKKRATKTILKIHGCVSEVATIRTTISTITNKILSQQRESVVKEIFESSEETNCVVILGYSCSDIFDIVSTIENLHSSKAFLVYVEHDSDMTTISDFIIDPISKHTIKNPFVKYNGVRLKCKTEIFIELLWNKYWADFKIDFYREMNWLEIIDTWINSLKTEHIKYSILGHLFYDLSFFDKTINYCTKSLLINAGKEVKGEGAALSNIGLAYHGKGDYETAFSYFIKAKGIFESIDFKLGIATSLNNIGYSYIHKKDKIQSLKWLKKAMRYLKENDFKESEICKGYILNSFGTLYYRFGEYDNSIVYLFLTLDVRQKGSKLEESRVLAEIGNVYKDKGDILKSISYYKKALAIADKFGNKIDKLSYEKILSALR